MNNLSSITKMKSRSSGYSSDSEQNIQQDLSVLRKPIHTALTGFLEAKRAYENGTEEIRRLLSRECDIIYECNICRNMFRSLTNFISHKRVYCRNSFNSLSHNLNPNRNGYIDHDVSTIIQAEENYVNKSTNTTNSKSDCSNKDLSSIVERLLKREQENRLLKLTDFYDQVNHKLTQDEILRKKHVLQLDKVPNSDAAVYQTVKNNESDNIKNEVNEVVQLLENDKNVLGPDGKLITEVNNDSGATSSVSNVKDSTVTNSTNENKSLTGELTCNICNKKYTTEKTLKLHIQANHISSTYVYQCPSCLQTFLQPGAVIRHLSNDHKKSARRIRLMRESIYKRRVKVSEIQKRGPSKELARLQLKMDGEVGISTATTEENQLWVKNNEWSNMNASSCTYCGKTFERKAVLTTHLANCPMKSKTSTNTITRRSNESRNSHRIDSNSTSTSNSVNNESNIIKTEKKLMLEHSILASIDLTQDDCIPAVVSKRKRKKTLKILKKDSNDIDSEKLNEMFLKLGCSDNNMSLNTISVDSSGSSRENSNDNSSIKTVVKVEKETKDNRKISNKTDQLLETSERYEKKPKLDKKSSELMDDSVLSPKSIHSSLNDIVKIENLNADEITQSDKQNTTTSSGKTSKDNQKQQLDKSNPTNQSINSDQKQQSVSFLCRICEKQFDVMSNVRRHISMFHYRSRKFGCRICGDYKAFRKFDVVNHLNSIHSLTGDKEVALGFVEVYDNKNKIEGIENDIVVVENNEDTVTSEVSTSTDRIRKRVSRQKLLKETKSQAVNEQQQDQQKQQQQKQEKQQEKLPIKLKFTRSSSNISLCSNDNSLTITNTSTSKRPIRNRIKPVHKDFVYDLSHILKKDMISEILPVKTQKRRNTLSTNGDVNGRDELLSNKMNGIVQQQSQPQQQQEPQIPIKGSAQKMAKLAVTSFQASYGQMPDNFPERNNFPIRVFSPLTSTVDDSSQNFESYQDKPNAEQQTKFRRMSDDSIIHVLSKRKRLDSNLMLSRKNTKSMNGSKKSTDKDKKSKSMDDDDQKIMVKCPTEKEFKEYLIANKLTEPVKKVSVPSFVERKSTGSSSTSPPSVTKRITLMQRLAENQHKKLQQSLLRTVLEN